jgi:hypothetical protein
MDEDEILPGDEHADAVRRLGALAETPLSAGLVARTLDRVRGTDAPRSRGIGTRVLVAATVGGLVFGGVGLAAADVLPAPVQEVAHTALDRVGVHVPPGHDRYNDPVACPGGPYRNHGVYVRSHKRDPAAGKSPCGKPKQSVNPSGAEKTDRGDEADGGHGPPPWAHNKDKKNTDKSGQDESTADDETPGTKGKQPDDVKPGPVVVAPTSSTSSTITTSTSTPPTTSTSTTSTSSP